MNNTRTTVATVGNMIIATRAFKFSNGSIHAFLKHNVNGLPAGTSLISPKRNLTCNIVCRVLQGHAIGLHKRFPNEHEVVQRVAVKDHGHPMEHAAQFTANEATNGLEYQLTPIGHDEKPMGGERLTILTDKMVPLEN